MQRGQTRSKKNRIEIDPAVQYTMAKKGDKKDGKTATGARSSTARSSRSKERDDAQEEKVTYNSALLPDPPEKTPKKAEQNEQQGQEEQREDSDNDLSVDVGATIGTTASDGPKRRSECRTTSASCRRNGLRRKRRRQPSWPKDFEAARTKTKRTEPSSSQTWAQTPMRSPA